MKGLLFFAGSLVHWAVKKPQQFIYLHLYILALYRFDHNVGSYSSHGLGLLFTLAVLAPLFLVIYMGMPLDCLDYKAAILRENNENSAKTS